MAKTWRNRVQEVYSSLEELESYEEHYGVAARCGFQNASTMWLENPVIGGSTNPADFGLVPE